MSIELRKLEEQFLYQDFYDSQEKEGWILNIKCEQEETTASNAKIYFIDPDTQNFVITVPFYYSLYIEGDALCDIDEYIKRMHQQGYHYSEIVKKHDSSAFNHLCTGGSEYLYVEIKYKSVFNILVRDLKRIIRLTKKSNDDLMGNSKNVGDNEDVKGKIRQIHEYDIEDEVKLMTNLNIRCGLWYNISYNGEKYQFNKSERTDLPKLKIFAFDIEATKQPLQFPNGDRDEIMMISVKTESFSELIVNRGVVGKNVEDFNYAPTQEFTSFFNVINESNERFLLVRFIELLQQHKPHIITTYNGTSFDFPFLEKRALLYDLSFKTLFGFQSQINGYNCMLMIHLDCYLWVKKDSCMPRGVMGLKAVTKTKLCYVPEELDPEEMVQIALDDPNKMARYLVSDAVATYFLFLKFSLKSIYTMCTIVPQSPYNILSSSSEARCEALLISQAIKNNLLIPSKRISQKLQVRNEHVIENISFARVPTEPPRIGIYRSDFTHHFNINELCVQNIINELDEVLNDFKGEDDYEELKNALIKSLKAITGPYEGKSKILKVDLKNLYAQIMLTNRLQPTSMVNRDFYIRCEYFDDKNRCQKHMEWSSRIEYYPPTSSELDDIRNKAIDEYNLRVLKTGELIKKIKTGEDTKKYEDLKDDEQIKIMKSKIVEYSKKVYNVVKKHKIEKQTSTVCQREFTFFIDIVKFLNDKLSQLNVKQQEIKEQIVINPNEDLTALKLDAENLEIYKQAYVNILDSFHGYIVKDESRWHSIEMAGIVYSTGVKIIAGLRKFINNFGSTLDVDSSSLWIMLPDAFHLNFTYGNSKEIPFFMLVLNHFIHKNFINDQYQEMENNGYTIKPKNTISIELSELFKCIFFPAALQEDRLYKKRFIAFNDNAISLTKGFELVRNGEINLVKKIQEDLMPQYAYGNTLEDCYRNLNKIAKKWLNIVYTKGCDVDDDLLLHLLTDTKLVQGENLAADKATIITAAARRMTEILGKAMLQPQLKVEFIISKYPETKGITERVIPTIVFKSDKKEDYLKSWCKGNYDLKSLIDWGYYKTVVEKNIKRLISLPALYQGISNPVPEVQVSKHSINDNTGTLDFCVKSKDIITKEPENDKINCLKPDSLGWMAYYEKLKDQNGIIFLYKDLYTNEIQFRTSKAIRDTIKEQKVLYLDVPKQYCLKNKIKNRRGFYPWSNKQETIPYIEMMSSEFRSNQQTYKRLLQHIATRKVYELELDPFLIELGEVKRCAKNITCLLLTTFNYNDNIIYVFGRNNEFTFISKLKHKSCIDIDVMSYFIRHMKDVLVLNLKDINFAKLQEMFSKWNLVFVSEPVVRSLATFEDLVDKQKELHCRLIKLYTRKLDISNYSKIPIRNINQNYLDVMFLRELREANTFCDTPGKLPLSSFKTEIINPGYIKKYCIMFECIGSLLLSIVQYEKFVIKTDLYAGVTRKDLEVLQKFIKKVIVDFSANIKGTEYIINDLNTWVLRDSNILSSDLREVCNLIHQRFILNIIGNLKKLGIKIVFVSRNIFCIETEKDTLNACESFFEYLQEKISSYEGYEFLILRKLHYFEKILFFTSSNYFYLKNDELFSFSNCRVPSCYLKKYFTDDLTDPHYIYDIITHCDDNVFELIVSSLSFLKGTEDIISNCYRLTKKNEFEQAQSVFVEMLIHCEECNNENIMRDRCAKCGTGFSREEKNENILEYITFYLNLELSDDTYCERCRQINERVLYDACKCGGMFKHTSFVKELLWLISQLSNIHEKEVAEKALAFYGVV